MSPLCTIPPAILDSISVETYLHLFDHTMTSLLDKHAPLKSVTCPFRESKPYITQHIINEKHKRSKLETIYRRRKTAANLLNYKTQAQLVAKLITLSKRTHFKKLVTDCENQPKKLWSTLQSLLSRSTPPILPNSISSSNLAKRFITFFDQKVVKLCASISKIQLVSSTHQTKTSPPPPSLSAFSPATPEEIRNIVLTSSNASCLLDSIPTFLLKSCLDSLLNPITTVINKALQDGFFPTTFKTANIYPLLKKHNLPHEELSSYRPISNLNFISKVLERVIQTRLNNHLSTFPSICRFQSAYRKFHSCETALLRIHNDISLAINHQKVTALVLLDLSAAFDTIDHSILLSRLHSTYGLTGNALALLSSYLSNRFQKVTINNNSSDPLPLTTGVPQGSVLGPLLFTLYTSPISEIFTSPNISFHLYADDTQLYISFSSSDSTSALNTLSTCLDAVYSWLTLNRLSVNPDKTEYLLFGTPQQRSKMTQTSLDFRGKLLSPSAHARNLGVEFDSNLTFEHHISNICRSSYFQIRQLRQIRSSLTQTTAIQLANALVSSKLDYCNSLLYQLPET